MDTECDFRLMRKQERAHFFSPREQDLILRLYEEEKDVLTAKSNTTSASKLRVEAWQRIADRINAASDSGYRRSWQQVKVKHKNIVQSARRRRAEVMKTEEGSATPSMTSAEDDFLDHKDSMRLEVPGGACIDAMTGSDNSLISGSGHPVLLLPVTKTEPESLSSDDTDISDSQFEGDVNSFRDKANATSASHGPRRVQRGSTEDVRTLYCRYLKKEMENRDQEMAYRALKMRKLEKEILLLDKQLM